nr:hypothetical protein [Tanacetum cinerariifolium]
MVDSGWVVVETSGGMAARVREMEAGCGGGFDGDGDYEGSGGEVR